METIRRMGILAIPGTFLLSGAGMLWLLAVENAPGNFFQQVLTRESAWLGAHLLLLLGTILLLPAALTMRSAIMDKKSGLVATLLILIIAPTAMLLGGQYAIDFVVPLIAKVGGEATKVHALLSLSPFVDLLFYKLPNLVFLAMMLLSFLLVWRGPLSGWQAALIVINWFAVLLANLVHPAFQRGAILSLAISFIPLTIKMWQNGEKSANRG